MGEELEVDIAQLGVERLGVAPGLAVAGEIWRDHEQSRRELSGPPPVLSELLELVDHLVPPRLVPPCAMAHQQARIDAGS